MSDPIVINVSNGPGPAGVGVPAGGTANQVLAKIDATDYNTHWVTGGGGGSAAWGDITGTLSAQTDLQTALNGKVPTTRTVAGKALSADVTLVKADVGLGNVDNTSDANKPVSTAQATAIGQKQDTLVSGTNIKTVNSQSILGSGDIAITGGSGTTTVYFSGESNVAITTGEKQPLIPCPVSGTIVGWSMTSYPATTAACSIWKLNGSRPTVANKITASAPPTLTAATNASSTTLTGWTTAVTAGDLFVLNVDSNSAATSIYVALEVQ